VPSDELIAAFQRAHPEHESARSALDAFATELAPGLEVDKSRWDSISAG
jgi:hypothetical protein